MASYSKADADMTFNAKKSFLCKIKMLLFLETPTFSHDSKVHFRGRLFRNSQESILGMLVTL